MATAKSIPTGREGKRVYARWPFNYEGYNVSRHEIFNLTGARNDDKLLRMRYCEPVRTGTRTFQAPNGGPYFISESGRDDYEKERRRQADLTRRGITEHPKDEDRRQAQLERRLLEESPLNIGGGG